MAKDMLSPGFPSSTLWTMNPEKRKIDASGVLSVEDTLIAVARGMRPSFALLPLENRAVIKAGLTVLGAIGESTVNVANLKITVINLKKDDDALVKAAGTSRSGTIGVQLARAAAAIRAKVAKIGGKALSKAAWGARGLFILGVMPGFLLAHSATAIGVNFIPVAGQIISAAMAAHIAITQAIAKQVATALDSDLKAGLKQAKIDAKARVAAKVAAASKASASRTALAPVAPAGVNWKPWAIGGTVVLFLLGGGYYFSQKRKG